MPPEKFSNKTSFLHHTKKEALTALFSPALMLVTILRPTACGQLGKNTLLVDFETMTTGENNWKRDTLRKKAAKIYADAPLPDNKSYSLAQKNLRNGES